MTQPFQAGSPGPRQPSASAGSAAASCLAGALPNGPQVQPGCGRRSQLPGLHPATPSNRSTFPWLLPPAVLRDGSCAHCPECASRGHAAPSHSDGMPAAPRRAWGLAPQSWFPPQGQKGGSLTPSCMCTPHQPSSRPPAPINTTCLATSPLSQPFP